MCRSCLQFLESGGIVRMLEILEFGSTKGDKLLGEVSKEQTHERLVGG